jgi:membrane-associated PAP2 superfamily phosphatase
MTARSLCVHHDGTIALAALGAVLLWDLSGLDPVVSHWFGNAHGFAWRNVWLTETVLHRGGRALAWCVLAVLAVDMVRPLRPGPSRVERLFWLGITLACLLLVPALKHASHTSCPWDLAMFGGLAHYVPHWRLGVLDGGPGHCFPSGHAVAAFAFLSGYFLWRGHRPVAARRWLVGVLITGVLFGGAQLVRGAHFLSHILWSAWLCWAVCALAARLEAVKLHRPPWLGRATARSFRGRRGDSRASAARTPAA